MVNNNTELHKLITEQDKIIQKLIAASTIAEKRMVLLDKKLMRLQHQSRDHTNILNFIKRKMGRE